jgi:molybdate-binding protein
VGARTVLYPREDSPLGTLPPDGVARGRRAAAGSGLGGTSDSPPTLVIAGCDPSARLLESSLAAAGGPRLLALGRSSRKALDLLRDGLVHAAGVHLGSGRANAEAVLEILGPGHRLLRIARWEEGIVLGRALAYRSAAAVARARLRWVAREPGAGARLCLDRLLGPRRSLAASRRPSARDHRSVAEAVRAGFADAGICLRLCAEEVGLRFLPVEREDYDLCYPAALEEDPAIAALVRAVRSAYYRGALAALGHGVARTGEVHDAA